MRNGDIETTFYLILNPGDDLGDDDDDNDDEMSSHYVTFRHFYNESKHFGLLASVFPSHAVYFSKQSFLQAITFSSTSICVSKTIFLFTFQKRNGDY